MIFFFLYDGFYYYVVAIKLYILPFIVCQKQKQIQILLSCKLYVNHILMHVYFNLTTFTLFINIAFVSFSFLRCWQDLVGLKLGNLIVTLYSENLTKYKAMCQTAHCEIHVTSASADVHPTQAVPVRGQAHTQTRARGFRTLCW